jgi:hypothetical protein
VPSVRNDIVDGLLPEITAGGGDCGEAGQAGNACCATGVGGDVTGGTVAYRFSTWLGAGETGGGLKRLSAGADIIEFEIVAGAATICELPPCPTPACVFAIGGAGADAGFFGAAKLLFTTPDARKGSRGAELAGGAMAACVVANVEAAGGKPVPIGRFA